MEDQAAGQRILEPGGHAKLAALRASGSLTDGSPMRQLSGHDASFLYSDTVNANSNATFVQIYDQSTAPGGNCLLYTSRCV